LSSSSRDFLSSKLFSSTLRELSRTRFSLLVKKKKKKERRSTQTQFSARRTRTKAFLLLFRKKVSQRRRKKKGNFAFRLLFLFNEKRVRTSFSSSDFLFHLLFNKTVLFER